MIAHLDGDFETVDYKGGRSVLLYDNIEEEIYPVHWHNAIEIIMPLVNGLKITCGSREYLLAERDIFIIPAGELHSLCAGRGRRLIFMCDNKSLGGNPVLSGLKNVITEPIHINKDYDADFRAAVSRFMTDIYTLYSDPGEMSEVYIYIKLLSMLARIKERIVHSLRYDGDGKYADKFRMILAYIDKKYMYDISLDALAELAGYSKYHFSRIFKKYCSETFVTLLNKRRIKAAELLLVEENISVTEIAMRSGFSSLTTFNRVFKEIKGCTPSEYKKLYRVTGISERGEIIEVKGRK